MVNAGMVVYRVVNLNTFKIKLGVPQNLINMISVGSEAKVKISALHNFKTDGVVRFISPQADEQTGTFQVEINVPNTEDRTIRAGMIAHIDLAVTDLNKKIVVPHHALISKNGNNSVYMVKESKAILSEVSIDQTIGSQVIVDSGINEGDSLVVVGMKKLGINTPIWIESVHN
jgi:RND family efflux transporter MFP subunit